MQNNLRNQTILKNTTISAIVRDEMINPAQLAGMSGIRSFVETHARHVESMDIVDTGSIDGTRQELEQLASEFSNLNVYDHPFVNYVDARNFGIKKAKTEYSLVLDCDEVLTNDGFEKVQDCLPLNSNKMAIMFLIRNVVPLDSEKVNCIPRIRFFKNKFVKYGSSDGVVWEHPYLNGKRLDELAGIVCPTFAQILHFRPDENGLIKKYRDWYLNGKYVESSFKRSPSACGSFEEWKKPSPVRLKYN